MCFPEHWFKRKPRLPVRDLEDLEDLEEILTK